MGRTGSYASRERVPEEQVIVHFSGKAAAWGLYVYSKRLSKESFSVLPADFFPFSFPVFTQESRF